MEKKVFSKKKDLVLPSTYTILSTFCPFSSKRENYTQITRGIQTVRELFNVLFIDIEAGDPFLDSHQPVASEPVLSGGKSPLAQRLSDEGVGE